MTISRRDGGPYADLIRSWVRVFPSWEDYNAAVGEDMQFWPKPQPHVYDGRSRYGVTNDLRDLEGLADGPERALIFVLPVGSDLDGELTHDDADVPCALLACGLDWKPPVIQLVHDATLRDAKWVFTGVTSLTAALHTVRGFR